MVDEGDPLKNPLAFVMRRLARRRPNRLIRTVWLDEASPTGLVDADTGEPFEIPPEYRHLEPYEYLLLIGQ